MKVSESHWINDDDLRMKAIPASFKLFWDYASNPIYRLLEAMIQNNRLPRLSVFHGPPGSGKTAVAYLLGCASSCSNLDPVTREPCGECRTCRYVRLGKDAMTRESLIEIDCADRQSGSRPIDEFSSARAYTSAYRSSKPGDPLMNYIVFGDESQRLSPADREAFLKMTEKWAGAHVVLATTDLDRLAVPGPDGAANPLLSRATVFSFRYPSRQECVAGIQRTGKQCQLEVDGDAAEWVADKCRCSPRECLGELYLLSNFGPRISMEVIRSLYREQADSSGQIPVRAGGTDEPDVY